MNIKYKLKDKILELPKEIQKKIYILCFRIYWRDYVPITAKVPSWYHYKNDIEKEKFNAKLNNIHFMHLSFNCLPENKKWIMGCQCEYCITIDQNLKNKEYRKQYKNPYYFTKNMPITDTKYNLPYIITNDIQYIYDPLCGSMYESLEKYAIKNKEPLLYFNIDNFFI